MSDTTDAVVGAIPSGYKEASFGTVSAPLKAQITTVYPMVGDPSFVDLEDDYSSNADEIKALPGATEETVRKTRGKLSRTMRLAAESFADFLIWGTGNFTTGAASSAVAEVWTLEVTGLSAGKFKLRDVRDGQTTVELNYNVADSALETALEAILGAGNVTVALASGVHTITLGGSLAATDYPLLELIVTQDPTGGSFVLETDTEGQAATQYLQTIKEPSICTLNPPSFPYAEGLRCAGSVDAYRLYPGCVVGSLGFDIESDDFIPMALELMTSGQELLIPTFTFPANDSAMTRLMGNMAEVWIGDDFTDPFKVAIDELAKFSVKFNFNPTEPERINNIKTVSEFQYPKGGMTLDVSAAFKGGKSSRYYQMIDACRDGYRPKVRIKLDPKSTPQRPIVIDFNSVRLGGGVKPAGREQRTELAIMPLSNTTDSGRFTAKVTTAKSTYLATA